MTYRDAGLIVMAGIGLFIVILFSELVRAEAGRVCAIETRLGMPHPRGPWDALCEEAAK